MLFAAWVLTPTGQDFEAPYRAGLDQQMGLLTSAKRNALLPFFSEIASALGKKYR
jgi:hypothetical protein